MGLPTYGATLGRAQLAYGPGHSPVVVVPHASNPIQDDADGEPAVVRAIFVGVSGDIKGVVLGTTAAVLFTAVPAGIFNVAFTHIQSTGTTATNMVALF